MEINGDVTMETTNEQTTKSENRAADFRNTLYMSMSSMSLDRLTPYFRD